MQKSFIRVVMTTAFLMFSSVALVSTPAVAQTGGFSQILGGASDKALDKLSQPGAFFSDKAVRILLPGPLQKASKLLRFTGQGDAVKDLQKTMNDVAGRAANEAKPIFRNAIDGINLRDGVGIAKSSSGATDFLRDSSGDVLSQKIRPLVFKAMGESGAFNQLDKLSSNKVVSQLGLNSEKMTDHVTKKTMEGIFKYMAAEESKVRKNPLKALSLIHI